MWKYLLLFIVLSLVMAVAGSLAILNWPALVLNRSVLQMAASYAGRIGVDISWSNIDISSRSLDLLDKKLSLSVDDLCVTAPPTIDHLCLEKVAIGFRYSLWRIIPKILEVGPIDITGGRLDYSVAATDGKNERDAFPIPKITLPSRVRDSMFFPVHVVLDEVNIRQKDSDYSGKISLNMEPTPENRLGELTGQVSLNEKASGLSADVNVILTSPSYYLKDDWQLKGQAHATLHRGEKAVLDVDVSKENADTLNNRIKLSLATTDTSVDLVVNGAVQAKKLDEKLSGTIHIQRQAVNKISFANCDLKLAAEPTGFNSGGLDVACPVNVDFKVKRFSPILQKISKIPDQLSLDLSVHAKTFLFPDLSQSTAGSLHAKMRSIEGSIVTTSGQADVQFSGIPSHSVKEWSVATKLDVELVVKEFARLKEALNDSDYAIPAPLNVLDGTIIISILGDVPSLTQLKTFPISLETRLSSPKENLDIVVTGEATVHDITTLDMDVLLQNIKIELPSLSSTSIPKLFPDDRITTKPAAISKGANVTYNVNISTPDKQPVALVSNLTQGPIPVNVNVQLSNDGMTGNIVVNRVPLNLFRRDAVVESFAIKLDKPLDHSEVKGRLKVSYVDYTIRIVLLGTVEKPTVIFQSEPPLSQDDIMATLIYGEPFAKLDAGDASSVGNMSSAIASRALGISSLYILASTPIQSVSYDPDTKMFSAKLKLGKKTSLTIGSSGEGSKQVGLQKRIGKGWIVNTNVVAPPGGASTRASAFIEWHKRY